jgi:DNA polymerase III sliding clamp (beta) subunit (PCNA family)
MRYFLILCLSAGFSFMQPAHASEITEQIKRACLLKENMDHPVCVKRAEQRAKMKAARDARERAQLDSILGRDPAEKPTH